MVSLVDQMLALPEASPTGPHAPRADRPPAPDRGHRPARIDTLVYELYGLTEEEIGIVEGGGSGA